jgi:hypothetical protein
LTKKNETLFHPPEIHFVKTSVFIITFFIVQILEKKMASLPLTAAASASFSSTAATATIETINHNADRFSVSSLLWRAGWSPSGLLSFRKNPVPATLFGTLEGSYVNAPSNNNNINNNSTPGRGGENVIITNEHNETLLFQNFRTVGIPLQIPLQASTRCGGMLMENFETGHASLAPVNAFNNSNSATKTSDIISSNNNNASPLLQKSQTQSAAAANQDPLEYFKSQFDDDILLTSRCKINVDGMGDSDPDFYARLEAAVVSGSGGWFGGTGTGIDTTLSEIDGMMFRFRISIWNTPASTTTTSSFSSPSPAATSSFTQQSSTRKRTVIASYNVTRVWRDVKRVATLLQELHPELILPLFSQFDSITNSAQITSSSSLSEINHAASLSPDRPSDHDDLIISDNNELELRLELIRNLIRAFQRNSAIATHSPVIVMFLLEEDQEAFYKFLQTMEVQLKTQSDARSAKLHQSIDFVNHREAMIRQANEPQKKEVKEGFFASLFGGSSHGDDSSKKKSSSGEDYLHPPSAIARMIPTTPEQHREADARIATGKFLAQDIAQELVEWREKFVSYFTLDSAMRKVLKMTRSHAECVRDYSDCFVEHTNELVSLKCPFSEPAFSASSFASPISVTSTKTGVSSSSTGVSLNNLETSDSSAFINNPQLNNIIPSSPSAVSKIEQETKSNLRMAVMLLGSRWDSLIGAENMLTALCNCTKACLLISKSCFLYLQHHKILAERASQISNFSQEESGRLLDFVIHTVRPIAVEEILELRKELGTKQHTISVLFYSLSRQLCDTILKTCATLKNEATLMQKEQDDQLEFTISHSSGGVVVGQQQPTDAESLLLSKVSSSPARPGDISKEIFHQQE